MCVIQIQLKYNAFLLMYTREREKERQTDRQTDRQEVREGGRTRQDKRSNSEGSE